MFCGQSLVGLAVPPHENNLSGGIHQFWDNLLEYLLFIVVSSDSYDYDDEESEHNLHKCIFISMGNTHFASLLPASLSPLRSQLRSDEWEMRCFWFVTQDNIWKVSS